MAAKNVRHAATSLPPPPPPPPPAARGPARVFYVDASAAYSDDNIPRCDPEDPDSPLAAVQRLLAARRPGRGAAGGVVPHHSTGPYAGGWFVAQALLASEHVTTDESEASITYLDVHCYYATAMLSRRLRPKDVKRLGFDAAEVLGSVLKAAAASSTGSKTAVFLPGPLPARLRGKCKSELQLNSTFVVAHSRPATCVVPSRMMLAPVPSNDGAAPAPVPAPIAGTGWSGDGASGKLYKGRKVLLTFAGEASDAAGASAGMKLRHAAIKALQGGRGAVGRATCESCNGSARLAREDLLRLYRGSKFCLVIPGDGQAGRMLTEVVLQGCIPVFVGPPFATVPLASHLDYRSFSVAISVTNTKPWAASAAARKAVLKRKAGFEVNANVETIDEVLDEIQDLTAAEISELQGALEGARRAFMYRTRLDPGDPSATDLIVEQIVEWADAAVVVDGGGKGKGSGRKLAL
ncbi:hypothetical protein MNEG_9106 [Monoraphidium neglectum]|uniref:Exostosin GT47 domain-containing protein n=1 Tax=Monoraphidium neglectum TaxID=145388 RepID=A0A0D2MX90_9CHLO|nr:hypothetical protein MNEG_9106 [Monoraphidium neglectum]KIY98855.1 hypothetical protein MNEG_9106 [Monoraphidium neglectum]|eukprot:XP_013897875.1 hypothetical protein MNEG_9106 [Monoraphidium neglectum]